MLIISLIWNLLTGICVCAGAGGSLPHSRYFPFLCLAFRVVVMIYSPSMLSWGFIFTYIMCCMIIHMWNNKGKEGGGHWKVNWCVFSIQTEWSVYLLILEVREWAWATASWKRGTPHPDLVASSPQLYHIEIGKRRGFSLTDFFTNQVLVLLSLEGHCHNNNISDC